MRKPQPRNLPGVATVLFMTAIPEPTMPRHSLLALAALIALAACATPDSRIRGDQSRFDQYPASTQEKIRAGQIDVGFTPEQVQMALGKPDRAYTRESTGGASEVWSYSDSRPGLSFGLGAFSGGATSVGGGVSVGSGGDADEKLRVVFEGGKVTAIERAR